MMYSSSAIMFPTSGGSGDLETAEKTCLGLLAGQPEVGRVLGSLWAIASAMGELNLAVDFASRACKALPEDGLARYGLSARAARLREGRPRKWQDDGVRLAGKPVAQFARGLCQRQLCPRHEDRLRRHVRAGGVQERGVQRGGEPSIQGSQGRPPPGEIHRHPGNVASGRIFLMPAGSGCVPIKKEVVY